MKKLLLVLAIVLIAGIINAQENKRHAIPVPTVTLDPLGNGSQQVVIGQKLSEFNIGATYYDLQTYGSMQKRIYAYPDGTIAAAWMMGFEQVGWPDRGTGYNYYNGSSWGDAPFEKIESIRSGWPCYAPLGANGEVIASHALPDADWVILINIRTNKGVGDWMESSVAGPEVGQGIVWPALVTGGTNHNTIHLLARTYNSASTPYNGQNGALLYYRSTDGGATWDIENHLFDELGPDYFESINADEYTWAEPHGNTIAFSVGFYANPGCIMKSYDNGDTWEFIEVYQCPFYPSPGSATPDFGAGDGSHSIALDAEDNVHITFGRMVYLYNDLGELQFYPATDGLIYWNENMPVMDSTIISSYTLQFLQDAGNLIGWVTDPGISGLIAFPNYYCSLTSYPQMLVDGNNRIFVLWSGVSPDFYNNDANFRHIYGNSSNDGGITWNGMFDFNLDLVYTFSECVYPAISPMIVNNQFHFYFMNDGLPGIFAWPDPPAQSTASENYITYVGKPTQFLTGVNDKPNASLGTMEVSPNFPNPFNEVTFIDVTLHQPSAIHFTVCDLVGKVVYLNNYEPANQNKLRIRFENNSLSSGIYFYTVSSDSETFTGKMIVK